MADYEKNNDLIADQVITEDDIKEASELLTKYVAGKATIDTEATANQEWWRLRHWNQINRENHQASEDEKPTSAWLFNSLVNKHADIMDNFPKINVLPREENDINEAELLSKIIPVIHKRNGEEAVYSRAGQDLVNDGGAITGVFWDSVANDGMGEIVKKNVDVHNLFWQPGISHIQESRNVFMVMLEDVEVLRAQYPEYADRIGPATGSNITKYLNDDYKDETEMCEVVDWYYKKTVMVPAITNPDTGDAELMIPKQLLHYVKYAGDVLLYASENDPAYKDIGYYNHGKYPFVIRALFPVKETPWGFGFINVMRSPQKYIDALDQAILRNCMMKANPRWFKKKNAEMNTADFADWSKTFVEVSGGGDLGDSLKQIDVDTLPAMVTTHMQNKIEELKETSGNRDFSQGSTAQGVTAASAIAALQEAGGKVARDINKIMYRGTVEEAELEVELIRQFYTEPRSFRVDDAEEERGYRFMQYSTDKFQTGDRKAVFDIDISAEKQSPFSRAAQNETAKEMYSLGMFNPQMAESATVCIDMMEFEGKDQILKKIQNNSIIMQQYQAMMNTIIMADQMFPQLGLGVQAGLVDPMQAQMAMMQKPQGGTEEKGGTAEERAAQNESDTTLTMKARQKAANQASI